MTSGDATPAAHAARTTVILGLDPGLAALGWGVVVFEGARSRWQAHGVLRTVRESGRTMGADLAARIEVLAAQLNALLDAQKPALAAMEEFRFYGRGVSSSLQLANVTGMVREALRARSIPVVEYSAQTIKKAVTGSARANKGTMQRAVQRVLGLRVLPRPNHAADALAAALARAFRLPVERALEVAR